MTLKKYLLLRGVIISIFSLLFAIEKMHPGSETKQVTECPFREKRAMEEAYPNVVSSHLYWYINTGGVFFIENGIGKIIYGKRPQDPIWRARYFPDGKNIGLYTIHGYYELKSYHIDRIAPKTRR